MIKILSCTHYSFVKIQFASISTKETTYKHFQVYSPFYFIKQIVQTSLDIEVELVILGMWKVHVQHPGTGEF